MTDVLPLDLDGLVQVPQPLAALALTFTVFGEPIPKGSTKAFVVAGRARVTNDNPRTRNWQALINDAAHLTVGDTEPLTGPVAVNLRFTLARPTGRPKRVKHPDRRPDVDKLARAGLDALTGCVFSDDAQVVDLFATKRYVGHPDALREPGVVVDVWPVIT